MPRKKKARSRLSEEIRQAVLTCGVSRYRIAKDTGLTESMLSRFVNGSRGFSLEKLDVLAEHLDLHITIGGRPRKGK